MLLFVFLINFVLFCHIGIPKSCSILIKQSVDPENLWPLPYNRGKKKFSFSQLSEMSAIFF